MVNFTKIFGLAGAALVFAGMASAQGPTTCTQSSTTSLIRDEGTTELIAPITIVCTSPVGNVAPAGVASLQVFITPALPVTSKALDSTYSEAYASVGPYANEAGAVPVGGFPTVYGKVSGSTIVFTGLQVPTEAAGGSYTITIGNIRVNATSLTVGTGVPPSISATTFMSGTTNSVTPAALSAVTVAFAQNGLSTSKLYKSFTTAGSNVNGGIVLTGSSTGTSNFVVCNGYSPKGAGFTGAAGIAPGNSIAFAVQINENFTSAFKTLAHEASTQAIAPGNDPNSDSVSNAPNSGTRLQIAFSNVPANVTLYVPVNPILTTTAGSVAAITLTSSATGAFAAVTASSSGSVNGAAIAPVTVSSGSGTAIFEVTTDDLTNLDQYNVPVFLVTSANTVVSSTTPISVAVSFAPIGSTNIPNFSITSSTTTLTGSTFNQCATSLLFPFVTNQLGFDTGLAIANTSTDPFGSNAATPQTGTCTLNFYGSGAPSPSNVVTATIPSGTVYAQALSGIAAGFQGYMIAQCGFQFGHGFAFITDGVGSSGGLSQGYLAGVIPDVNIVGARAANAGGAAGAGSGESLGN